MVLVFIVLASLASLKFGLIFKILRPVLGFFVGLSVGAYLISLVSYDAVRLGSLVFGIIGAIATMTVSGFLEKI
ncbi:MAG TPA: hypothetical protein DEH25_13875 [Chloroflexi bacterium]|nr:hypothetical protein [Chloroflexota bacterium]